MTPNKNYNFGVYNTPSSLEALRYSEQFGADLALRLNNLQAGKETGYKQKVETFLPRFSQPDENLIAYINNLSLETIINMIRQGWYKSKIESTLIPSPSPSPSPSPAPNSSPTTPVPFPPGSLPTSGGDKNCTVIVAQEIRNWTIYDDGSSEYAFNTSTGTAYKDVAGRLKIFASFNYKSRNRAGVEQNYTHPVQEVPQNWLQSNVYDYFGYSLILGASGSEAEVYKLINAYNGYNVRNFIYEKRYQAYTYKVIYSDCPGSSTELPDPPPRLYLGSSTPPPPRSRRKRKMCCDCNTIASIMEAQFIGQIKLFELLKDHIDQRIKEEIVIHQKQLEALDFEDALKVILERVNESESNLWSGIKQ